MGQQASGIQTTNGVRLKQSITADRFISGGED